MFYIPLDRKFHSAFNGTGPILIQQKIVSENCRKLSVTLYKILFSVFCACAVILLIWHDVSLQLILTLLPIYFEPEKIISWKVIGNFRNGANPACTYIQTVVAENFARAQSLCCIPLDRKFYSAFNGMCPLSLWQEEMGEICRNLMVTFQRFLHCSLRMRRGIANLMVSFVIVS